MTDEPQKMVEAVLFDMDGTLVDSEVMTDESVKWVMEQYGISNASLPPYETRGRSWEDIVTSLFTYFSPDATRDEVQERLIARWVQGIDHVDPIVGAVEALALAARHCRVAVVSSSPHAIINRFVERLGAASIVPENCRIGADEISRPKPDPEGFLLAARRMGVSPNACVVFEDSRAGLQAARSAGMFGLAVLQVCAEPEGCRDLAHGSFSNYEELPNDFWSELVVRGPGAVEPR